MTDPGEQRALVAQRNAKRYVGLAAVTVVGWFGYTVMTGHVLYSPALAIAWFGYRGWAESR